jgi:hypothetical protein
MVRVSRFRIASITAAVLVLAAVVVPSIASAGSAPKVERLKGTFVLDPDAGTGTATGSLKGSVAITHVKQDFAFDPTPRFIDELVITRPDGSTVELTMDYLGTNFTTPALTGGGLAQSGSEVGEPWYTLTVSMAPGVNHPEQVWSYEGVTGITE